MNKQSANEAGDSLEIDPYQIVQRELRSRSDMARMGVLRMGRSQRSSLLGSLSSTCFYLRVHIDKDVSWRKIFCNSGRRSIVQVRFCSKGAGTRGVKRWAVSS